MELPEWGWVRGKCWEQVRGADCGPWRREQTESEESHRRGYGCFQNALHCDFHCIISGDDITIDQSVTTEVM